MPEGGHPAPLAGKVALVTGSSRGIGRYIALGLAEDGADVAVNYKAAAGAAEEVAARIRAAGRRAITVGADNTDRDAVRAMVARVAAELGGVDILVNNVGEFAYKLTREHSDADFERIIAGTIKATYYASLAALEHMRPRRWGRIINLGAAGAERAAGFQRMGPHMAGKSAVLSLTRTLAMEEGPFGVTVNAVCPGIVADRDLTREQAERMHDPENPTGRPGTSFDVADAVRFLARPASGFINGAAIVVSGGWEI